GRRSQLSEPTGAEPEKLASSRSVPASPGVTGCSLELSLGRDLRAGDSTKTRGVRKAHRRRAAAMARAESAVDRRLWVAWRIHDLSTDGLAQQLPGDGYRRAV